MKSAIKLIIFLVVSTFGLYTVDSFMLQGKLWATASSSAISLFSNPHQAVTINVNLITDRSFAQQSALLATVYESFEQFKPLGIKFKIQNWQVQPIAAGSERSLVDHKFNGYNIILSNHPQSILADHKWQGVAAMADPQKKFIIVGIKDDSLLESRQLVSTLQHELGHLFYAPHDTNSMAYVMSPVVNSSTTWSPKAKETIMRMKYRW